ncbi:MAG: glycosyl hydrolase family 18 protein [Patescibacteria group bacterium]|nr:glycosyl hydrolase family 18 protein [Patescibacteria group bacterium]
MKKVIIFFIIVSIFLATIFFLLFPNKQNNIINTASEKSVQIKKPVNQTKSVFVPYWAIPKGNESGYYQFIYFGLAVNESGINKTDAGYKNIKIFVNSVDRNSFKFLTIRMLDNQQNLSILKDKNLEKKIIDNSLEIAKNNSFDGIVLDLEVNAMPFDSMLNKIDDFVKNFYSSSKKDNLKFYVLLYGDTFYRIRPYNVENIAKNSDKILIMAYDFYKANGDPGPNFPYEGKEEYGYDFKAMTDDFLKVTKPEKLGVVFGFYGYNWTVDEKGRSKSSGTAITLNNVEQKFLNNCNYKNCRIERDPKSLETKINYEDSNSDKHVIWFEDQNSAEKKAQYLSEKGISDIIFWAYSYF